MQKVTATQLLAIVLTAILPQIGLADESPRAGEIIEAHIDACGGKEAMQKIASRRLSGSLARFGHGVPVEILKASPNKCLMITKFPKPGTVKQGYDGESAWSWHPTRGGSKLEGAKLASLAGDSWLHPMLHLDEQFSSIEYGTFDAEANEHVLRLEGHDGAIEYWRFSAESGRLARIEKAIDFDAQGEATAFVSFDDYRENDGVYTAWKVTTRLPRVELEMIVESLENNPEFDEALFSPDFE